MNTLTKYEVRCSSISVSRDSNGEWSLQNLKVLEKREALLKEIRRTIPLVEYREGQFWDYDRPLKRLHEVDLRGPQLDSLLCQTRCHDVDLKVLEELLPFTRENPECEINLVNQTITTFKSVRDTFYDIYSNTLKYTVGQEVAVPEAIAGDSCCGVGIHSSGTSYARKYGSDFSQAIKLLKLQVPLNAILSISWEKIRSGSCYVVEEVKDTRTVETQ
jgi:hypothetical protein